MGAWVADALHEKMAGKPGRALVLGLTFKEDVPDLRNSRVFDLVGRLRELGHEVDVADPLADAGELEREHGLKVVNPGGARYNLVVGAVPHAGYRALSAPELEALLDDDGILADLKGMWRDRQLSPAIGRWSL
jgi:UDP-N-acetyl-D-galactosamine dehydrogenase